MKKQPSSPSVTTRRTFLAACLSGMGLAMLPRRARAALNSPRLVFIFLRGGSDALSLFSPRGADWTRLQALRPDTAMTSPLAFSSELYAHPALAPLLTSDITSSLNVVLHSGGITDNRSHFDQQFRIETGSNAASTPDGFLARLSLALGVKPASIDRSAPPSLLGSRPIILSDPARVQNNATDGSIDPRWSRAQRLAMYRGTAAEVGSAAIDTAAASALAEGNVLAGELAGVTLASLTANHGYDPRSTFGGRLALAAQLMTSSLDPRLFTIDGEQFWDSHAAQLTNDAAANTSVYKSVRDLGTNLAAFKRDLVARNLWANTVVVVMSEFGRTIAQNSARGTDHGRAGAMLVMGGKVRSFADTAYLGPRRWTLPSTIEGSTPLAVTHDYRVVLTEILQRHLGQTRAAADAVFLNQAAGSAYLNVIR